MPKQVSIWAPILKGDPEPTMSLAVQANYTPTQNQYRELLTDLLNKEILSDPVKAKEQMQAMGETSSQPNPELSAIPVIVLSARDPADNRRRALSGGATAYFQKPPDNHELLTAIRQAMGETVALSNFLKT